MMGMTRFLLPIMLCISGGAWANTDCDRLSNIADDNGVFYGTKYIYTVQGPKGFRTNFHSAPSEQCKIKNLFLIPSDSVIAYQEFKNENHTWLYVMYIDKNGNDTTGWMREKDLKVASKLSLDYDE